MIQSEKTFTDWLDSQLNESIPDTIVAFNINVYESPFKIEIVGSNQFDKDDEDWACNEDWVPESRTILVSESIFGLSWEVALENLTSMAKSYLSSGLPNAYKLQGAKAFAIGFVDGNLNYVQ